MDPSWRGVRKAIDLDPDAHNLFANTLIDLGRLEEAETAYRKAIDLEPNEAAFRRNRGRVLCELGWFTTAETIFRKAVELDLNQARGHRLLGELLLSHGRVEQARAELARGEPPRTSNC